MPDAHLLSSCMLIPESVQLLGVLLVLAFIAGSIRLLCYCLAGRRTRLRIFHAVWFLVLSGLLLRIAAISVNFNSKDIGQGMAALTLAVLCFAGAAVLGVLALAYFAPTIWTLLQRRRFPSSPGIAPHTTVPMRWPEAVLFTLIALPLLGATWLVIVGNDPALVFRARSDQPLPWLKFTTDPPADMYDGPPDDWAKTSLYTQSPSGKWMRITFPNQAHYRRLAVLSPDSVLITWPSSPPLASAPLSVPFNNRVGAVYKKGLAAPAATVPGSDDIAAVPSGGFIATSCEPPPRCQDRSCRSCASFTVRRFDALGAQTFEATNLVPLDTALCDWWPLHRLIGDDLVYSANHCRARSNGDGYYRASPNGMQRITSRLQSDQYTFVDDKNEMDSLTQPVAWYHIPWIQDPM